MRARRPRRLLGVLGIVLAMTGCAAVPQVDVRGYVDEAIEGLSEGYYADSAEWRTALEHELPGLYAAESISDTHAALGRLTKVAGGEHSRFQTPREADALEGARYSTTGVPVPAVEFVGAVATVTLPAFSTDDPDELETYMSAAATIFASDRASDSCGWVVDLSDNGGGSLWAMLVAVSPLLDDGVIEVWHTRDGRTSEVVLDANTVMWNDEDWSDFGVLPGAPLKLPHRPVAIVQSTVTASAAESVIAAFAGQPQVATFGTVTAGFTTVNDGFTLPDGAHVTLSFALMGDRQGNAFDGPIPPDHGVDPTRGSAVAEAEAWVAAQCHP